MTEPEGPTDRGPDPVSATGPAPAPARGTVLDAVRLAVGTLTALPVRPPATLAAPVPGRAMALAPAAGLVPGLTAAVVAFVAARIGLATPVAAVLVVAVFALVTRALHLDGLADTADGLAASYDRERALDVMRRGDSGPAGVVIVVIVLLLQVSALAEVLAGLGAGDGMAGDLRAAGAVLVAAVSARVSIPVLCRRGVAPARPDGLGATVAGSVGRRLLLVSLAGAGLLCALVGRAAGLAWWAGPAAVVGAVAATHLLQRRTAARLGGITGDVIGAGVEIAAAAALLVLAAAT